MRILVIGGGVSGPVAALFLKRAGHDVELFDRVLDRLDVPATLNIHENGSRVLKHLGLLDQVVAAGNICDRYDLRTVTGDPVTSFPNPRNGDLVTITIVRSVFVRIVLNALVMEGVYVHLDKLLVGIEQPTDGGLGVKAKFRDGTVAFGDILIGADGVHSAVRRALFPTRHPVPAGMVSYFGIVDNDPSFNWTSRDHVFFTDNATAKSGMIQRVSDRQLAWCIFELKPDEIDPRDDWRPLLFDLRQKRAELADMARRWKLPQVFEAMIVAAKEIIPVTILDLETLPQWSAGNCVLIGGAKHAMVPFLGQSCGVALEDAEVLATLLARLPADPRRAFQLFQDARFHRVRRLAEAARTQGKRQFATTPIGATVGKIVMKVVSATGGGFSADEIVSYDGQAAVTEILFRNGLI
ncbi:hypothetical protein DFJ73DRAFT_784194 [Zopfochytrium polystomum]|nr:hypothetical protein DFJ73DRAFT_784194 [Zopfochytrium polystomum]